MPGPVTLDGSAVFGFITENGKMMSGGGGGGGIPDAPIDGQLYGRRNGAWEDIYAAQQYQDTIFVDPAGDATKDGKNPSGPTTWANAIANAAFDTLIVLSPGTYSDGDGPGTGTTTIPESNVSIVARQGGTGSNGTFLSDSIVIGAGIERVRFYGVRFDGGIVDNGSSGKHYFAACSANGGAYVRTNPAQWVQFDRCDFEMLDYQVSGPGAGIAGGGLVTVRGDTRVKSITSDTAQHFIAMRPGSICGRITSATQPAILSLSGASILDAAGTLAIDAPASLLYGQNTVFGDAGGAPVPVTAALAYFDDCTLDNATSTIGGLAPGGSDVTFSGIVYDPADPSNWVAAPSTVSAALDELAAQTKQPPVLFGVNGQWNTNQYLRTTGNVRPTGLAAVPVEANRTISSIRYRARTLNGSDFDIQLETGDSPGVPLGAPVTIPAGTTAIEIPISPPIVVPAGVSGFASIRVRSLTVNTPRPQGVIVEVD